jgi:hypothetical protein
MPLEPDMASEAEASFCLMIFVEPAMVMRSIGALNQTIPVMDTVVCEEWMMQCNSSL